MGFSIQTDHALQYVRVTHTDEMSLRDMREGRKAAGAILHQQQYRRVMVDAREIEAPPDTLSSFEIASTLRVDFPVNTRMAILVPSHFAPDARFSENVATNHGFDVRAFIQEIEAIAWLTAE